MTSRGDLLTTERGSFEQPAERRGPPKKTYLSEVYRVGTTRCVYTLMAVHPLSTIFVPNLFNHMVLTRGYFKINEIFCNI